MTSLIATATAFGLTYGLSAPLLALSLGQQGYGKGFIGANAAMHAVGVLAAAPLLPAVAWRLGPKLPIVAALLAAAAVLALFPVMPSIWLNQLSDETTRARTMAIYTAGLSFGFALGPLVLSVTGTVGTLPYRLGAGIALVALLCVAMPWVRAPVFTRPAHPNPMRYLSLAPVAIGATLVNAALETAGMSFLPLYAIRTGWHEDTATLLLSVLLLGAILLQLPIGWVGDRVDRRRLVIGLGAASTVGALAWPFVLNVPALAYPLLFVWGGVYTITMAVVGSRFKRGDLWSTPTMAPGVSLLVVVLASFLLFLSIDPLRAAAQQIKVPVDEASPADSFEISMPKFYIQNDTSQPMMSIETNRPDRPGWSRNHLAIRRVAPGDAFLVELPEDGGCQYRLRLEFDGTKEIETDRIDVCTVGQVDVTDYSAGDPKPVPSLLHPTIVNRSRHEMTQLFISPTAATGSGDDQLGRETISPRGDIKLDLPSNGECLFDLQAVFDLGEPRKMRGMDLCQAHTFTFNGVVPVTPLKVGSGFRISASGHIMTNNHVTAGCGSMALLAEKGWLPLGVVGTDPKIDVAVLQQPDVVTNFLSFRSLSSPVKVAERAIAIGFPVPQQLGGRVVTEGIVNSLSGERGTHTRFQLQTPIQPGSSGGPILDGDGLVIGVAVSRLEAVDDRVLQDVNFAIKLTVAAKFAESLGVPLRYEEGGKDLSTADIMARDGERVVQLLCRD